MRRPLLALVALVALPFFTGVARAADPIMPLSDVKAGMHCTALSVIELIKSTKHEIRGAEAVVVGASEIAGKPIALLLTEQMATVTLCHIATKDLIAHTRRAEILVVAVGKPNLIGADHVRDAAVVIDVGINRVTLSDGTKRTVGDVDFDTVSRKAAYITPVPGGVGPMTVAMLLRNTLRSAEILYESA